MLVAASALTLSVGSSAYFYKQIEAFRADLSTINTTLSSLGHKVSEMAKGDQNRNEALHTLSDQIKIINQRVDQLPSFETIDQINTDFDDLTAALQEHNIEVVLTPHTYSAPGSARMGSRNSHNSSNGHRGHGSSRGSRAPSGSRYLSDREEEARGSRTPMTRDDWGRSGSSRDYSNRRGPSASLRTDQYRADPVPKDQYRDSEGPRVPRSQRQPHPLPDEDNEDDTDLIDLVRRQQPQN